MYYINIVSIPCLPPLQVLLHLHNAPSNSYVYLYMYVYCILSFLHLIKHFNLSYYFTFCFCLCRVHVLGGEQCGCAILHRWRSEDNLWDPLLLPCETELPSFNLPAEPSTSPSYYFINSNDFVVPLLRPLAKINKRKTKQKRLWN